MNTSFVYLAKYCNEHTRIALIKIRHGPHMFLLNAIPKIIDLGGKHVTVKIIYVGATLKHCYLFIKVNSFFFFLFISFLNVNCEINFFSLSIEIPNEKIGVVVEQNDEC